MTTFVVVVVVLSVCLSALLVLFLVARELKLAQSPCKNIRLSVPCLTRFACLLAISFNNSVQLISLAQSHSKSQLIRRQTLAHSSPTAILDDQYTLMMMMMIMTKLRTANGERGSLQSPTSCVVAV